MKTANFKFLLFTVLFITSISIIGWNGAFDQVSDKTRLIQANESFDIPSDDTSLITQRSNIDYSDFVNPNLPSKESNNIPSIPDSAFFEKPMLSIESVQYESHPVISIIGNDDFVRQNFTGSGLLTDPYLIQGYEITANHTHLISIIDTTAYFKITGNLLNGITGVYNGIDLVNVTNGFITVNYVGFSAHGIYLENSNGNNITLNDVYNNTANGIFLVNSETNIIGRNHFFTSVHGISLIASWSNIIEGNWVYDNREQGIAIYNSSFLDIKGNTALNNNWKGIIESHSVNNSIEGNFARYNGNDGIYSYACNGSKIISNMAYNNTWNGIVTQGNSNGLNISNNYAYNNTNVGLRLEFLSSSFVDSNIIYQNMEMGIWLFSSSSNQITNNNIYNNVMDGISLEDGSDSNFLAGNTLNGNKRGITILASSDNTIEMNNIDSSTSQGILVDNAINTDIDANTITNSWGSGIWVSNVNYMLIRNNDIFGNIKASLSTTFVGSGITAMNFGGNISGNYIASNYYWGIGMFSSGEHDLSHNTIVNNSDTGIFFEDVNGSTCNDNLIAGNLANGILLNISNGNQILFNVIADNGANGITITNSDLNYIHENEIFGNSGTTIGFPIRYMQLVAKDIDNNIVIDHIDYSIKGSTSGHGIFLDPSSGNRIEFNDIYGNSGSGAYFLEADGTEFSNNVVTENGENGIFLENSSYNTLFKNIITGNGYGLLGDGIIDSELKFSIQGSTSGHGIFLDPSHHNIISENEISHNFANGISLFESSDSTIVGNTITKNTNGIYLEDSDDNNLSHNIVSKNGDMTVKDALNSDIQFSITGSTSGHGIFLDPSDYNVIEHNFVFGNEKHGIYLVDSDFTQILKNSLSVNGFYGVYADLNSDESTISLNDFKHNNFGEGSQAYDDGNQNLFDENYWSDLFDQDSYKIDGSAGNSDYNPADNPFFPFKYDYTLPKIIFPNGGETLSGIVNIQWYRAYIEFNLPEEINYWLFYSSDGGAHWMNIPIMSLFTTTASDGQIIMNAEWKTDSVPDGSDYLVQVVAVDKSGSVASDNSDGVFQIKNGIETTDKTTTTKDTDPTTPSLTPSWTIIGSIFSISSYGWLIVRKRQRKE